MDLITWLETSQEGKNLLVGRDSKMFPTFKLIWDTARSTLKAEEKAKKPSKKGKKDE